ncbi:MAG: DUF4268 domain-containing protein [Lishizhenia sp.]
MFSKEELRNRKALFWNEFRAIMTLERSVSGRKVNWINYNSGIKFLFIRLDATSKKATFSIDIQPKDDGIREIVYEQFTELKKVLESEFSQPGIWEEAFVLPSQQEISRIYWELDNVNMFRREDKQKIFDFFKDNLLAFDRFYSEYNEILITLAR